MKKPLRVQTGAVQQLRDASVRLKAAAEICARADGADAAFLKRRKNISGNAAHILGLLRRKNAPRLFHRLQNRLHVERRNAGKLDDLHGDTALFAKLCRAECGIDERTVCDKRTVCPLAEKFAGQNTVMPGI